MTEWWPTKKAARYAGVTPTAVHNARRAGRLPGRLDAERMWEYDADAIRAYATEVAVRRRRAGRRAQVARERESAARCLDAEPLLRVVLERGGPAACGLRSPADREALRLARLYGRVTPRTARRLARRLGASKRDLWPPVREVTLDPNPLRRQVELRGGPAAAGFTPSEVRAYERASLDGALSLVVGDQLAARLGLTLWDLWPVEASAC